MSEETYWSWKPSSPTPSFAELPEGCFKGTQKHFESLSPGMRREILRSFQHREKQRQLLDRKAEVQLAAKQKL